MGCRSGDDRSAKSRRNGAVVSGTGVQAPPVPWFPRAAPLLLAPGRSPDRSLIALAGAMGAEPECSVLDSNAPFTPLDGGNAPGRGAVGRQVSAEDSPLEERTFIVAESDATATDGFAKVYFEQSSGAEETVESRELLAAVTFPPSTAVDLIVSHDFGDETSYSIVERVVRGRWLVRWASRRFSC